MDQPVSSAHYSRQYFEESCGGAEFFRLYGPTVLKPAQAYSFKRAQVAPGMRVLDLGCGRGEILYQARQEGGRGVGTDFAAAAAKLAREISGCPTLLCDAKALPFSEGAFDLIFFVGVIDHLHDWELERCFSEMARVLKPGGAVLIHTCANRHYYKTLSYGLRRALARLSRRLGLPIGEPARPRSDEDRVLHVNEHTLGGLRSFLSDIGWDAEVEARPNYKLFLRELYGWPLPPGFPIKPASRLKTAVYLNLLFLPGLRAFLAREFFALARPRRTC